MAEESDQEKTEPATGRKIDQAREEGKVPRSRELASFLILLVGVTALWMTSDWAYRHIGDVMRRGLIFDRETVFHTESMWNRLLEFSWEAMLAMLPVLLVVLVTGVVSYMAIGGLVISSKAVQFDPTRMDPIAGMKRLVSVTGLVELVKGVFKSILILGVAGAFIWQQRVELLTFMSMPISSGLISFMQMIFLSAMGMSLSLALIAAIDVPYQIWHYFKELRMSKSDLKRENKESEGDPEVKGRIRARQQQMARRRMMEAVPKADVVVTNPTHFAVALKYDAERMGAPTVVAKGADLMARAIRDLASEHGVPLLEAPPLARALYHHAEIDAQIPAALYTAVAEVMAYIYQLNQFLAEGGLPPQAPSAIAVPPGLDPAAD